MSHRKIYKFSTLILILTLCLLWLANPVSAETYVQLFPVDDGTIYNFDPIDGVGDIVDHDLTNDAYLNPGILENRGAMEFDLSFIPQNSFVQSAFLTVTPAGRSYPPNTTSIPIQLFGYLGNGTIEADDFNAGSSISTFDGFTAPTGVPVVLDVTGFLQNLGPMNYVGFSLKTDVPGGVYFGSLELGSSPTLAITLAPVIMEVSIDIKPSYDVNPINTKSKGKIPVAILSTADFDAPTMVVTTSLTFGKTGDETSLAFCNNEAEDVNDDGLPDQVCHFYNQETGFQVGDTEGILKGQTVDGIPIEGYDSVNILK